MNVFQQFFAFVEAEWAKIFGTAGANISQVVLTDIQLVGSGISGVLTAIESVTGIDQALVAKVQGYVASISNAASSIVTTVETNIAKPVALQIATDFTALQADLAGFTLPVAVTSVLNAVATLLPYIEAGVGILTAGTASSSATVAASQATGLSADEARLILKAA
jgi:hypothetical protein